MEQYPAAAAVWEAVAEAVGDGLDVADSGPDPTSESEDDITQVLTAALAGPLASRSLMSNSVPAARNPRDVDVVLLDRAELALVFGQVAPGKVAAPNPALTFRVESPFTDVDGTELTNDDIAYRAISQLLFVRGNVQSVDTASGDVPAVTTIDVADESLVAGVEDTDTFLGDVDVRVAEERIAGVDAVVRLGTSYLDFLVDGDDE